jgi:hypothetical protein
MRPTLLRSVDPIKLYPGLEIVDPATRRHGEIIKIEFSGRQMAEILIVFDDSDTPVNAQDYPNLEVVWTRK